MTRNLGPFLLEEVVGEGAMGEVWRGRHRRQDVPVALKVLKSIYGAEALRGAFRNEARAMARLDHPHVVMVLDHGVVPEGTASGLEPGSPYLVMDFASGGSLDQVDLPLTFAQAKAVLLTLLDALAHAHARGVIHRDLKPGNILLADAGDARPGLKLTDFGIAHAVHHEGRTGLYEQTAGTPFYMAPEQFNGMFRDYGPWTDLYALGCVAFQLVTGAVPYEGESLIEQAYQHMRAPIPKLEPVDDDVPAEFEGWFQTLVAKSPSARYQRAADAAWALLHIGPPPSAVSVASLGEVLASVEAQLSYPSGTDPTVIGTALTMPAPDTEALRNLSVGLEREVGAVCALRPLPKTWRRSDAARPMRLVGAGLGLYGLRDVPLVGRDKERDRIWAELGEVMQTRQPRLVVLAGPAGVGKSRLAEWIARRADEVGAAATLSAYHSADRGPSDGLRGLAMRHLRCEGLEASEAAARIRDVLSAEGVEDPWEWEALAEWLYPTGRRGQVDVNTVLRKLLRRQTRRRALILRAEDLQYGADTLLFLADLVSGRIQAPILIIATVRPDEFAPMSLTTRFFEELRASDRCTNIPVPSLPANETKVLVHEVLGLESALVDDVVRRSSGLPLFVTQLIGDWVHRGVLEARAEGFALRPGERATIPDSIYTVLSDRVARLIRTLGDEAGASLELAATLGRVVNLGEWRTVCVSAGVRPPPRLLDAVLAERLAVETATGFAFTSELLRETLLRRASEAGVAVRWHEACVTMLRATRVHRRGVAARIGRHLVHALRPEESLAPLLKGATDAIADGDYPGALALLEMRADALAAVPDGSEPHVEQAVVESDARRRASDLDRAETLAKDALAGARAQGLVTLEARALRMVGEVARNRGDFVQARRVLQAAADLLDGSQYDQDYGWTLLSLADATIRTGDLESARAIVMMGRALAAASNEPLDAGRFEMGLGRVERARGRNADAAEHYEAARDLMERAGSRLGIALCVNSRADIARYEGDLVRAEDGYREAQALYESLESIDRFVPPLNLALVLLQREEFAEALRTLSGVVRLLEGGGRRGMLGLVWLVHAPCAAGLGDWSSYDTYLSRALEMLSGGKMHDPDIAFPAERAGELAAAAGHPARARRAWELAVLEWKTLGRAADASRVQARLDSL